MSEENTLEFLDYDGLKTYHGKIEQNYYTKDEVEEYVNNHSAKLYEYTVALDKTKWVADGSNYKQSAAIETVTENTGLFVALEPSGAHPTDAEYKAYTCISDVVAGNKTVTFYASAIPADTISIKVKAFGEALDLTEITAAVTKVDKIPMGTCNTTRTTVDKVVAISGLSSISDGVKIAVRFTDAGTTNPTSGNLTLNVNSTGAKPIIDARNNTALTYSNGEKFCNNILSEFIYDGTSWCWTSGGDTYTGATLKTDSEKTGSGTTVTNTIAKSTTVDNAIGTLLNNDFAINSAIDDMVVGDDDIDTSSVEVRDADTLGGRITAANIDTINSSIATLNSDFIECAKLPNYRNLISHKEVGGTGILTYTASEDGWVYVRCINSSTSKIDITCYINDNEIMSQYMYYTYQRVLVFVPICKGDVLKIPATDTNVTKTYFHYGLK